MSPRNKNNHEKGNKLGAITETKAHVANCFQAMIVARRLMDLSLHGTHWFVCCFLESSIACSLVGSKGTNLRLFVALKAYKLHRVSTFGVHRNISGELRSYWFAEHLTEPQMWICSP